MKSLSKSALIIAVIIIVIAGLGLYYYESYGKVYVYLSDPGNSSFIAIYLTVTSIQVHSNKGWMTISNKTETIQLSSIPQFVASANLPTGNYTELRFVVESVMISLANNVNVSATLPSNVFKVAIPGGLTVKSGSPQYLTISIGPHVTETGNGSFILRPLITVTASNKPPK
ncbi:MAG: hypothetical protein C0171_00720 [Caldisphaera sp.]|jgi:hypothetical protein|uniref:DUF4382 domain-containing protein n=1 Tax=Caldisphaera sp. TaxID=2060322 RepID=UPI000CCAD850|nr:DUF4382 domain-containing protein [Caldisphaera sp.]PMP59974.1 MAG: hypothetical protein C0201_03705 [Caldisphaera sp.]PMP92326.1 MAG: hypothetical protein C0171_00720 [Caldisphaera sp.]